jgi:hypothetical protein
VETASEGSLKPMYARSEACSSGAHSGLKAAAASELPGVAWQRCKPFPAQSVQAVAPKAQRGFAAAMARIVFTAGSKGDGDSCRG